MSKFVCKRCGYSTKYKSHMKKHLSAIKECKSILGNESRENLINELYKAQNKSYFCTCGNSYYYSQGLTLHKKTCNYDSNTKLKNELKDELKDELKEELKQELKQELIVTNNITNNTINNNDVNIVNNNTINNIVVTNDFGFEDTSYLTQKFLEKCLGQLVRGIPQLTKEIHFNKNHPENHNIQATNIRGQHIKVKKDGKWEFITKNKALASLLSREYNILREYYDANEDEFKEKWNPDKFQITTELLDKIECDNPEILKMLNDENFLVFINQRELIKT